MWLSWLVCLAWLTVMHPVNFPCPVEVVVPRCCGYWAATELMVDSSSCARDFLRRPFCSVSVRLIKKSLACLR